MIKRIALMFAATAILAIPATSAFAAPDRTTGILPEEACFVAMPTVVQPLFCGIGNGSFGHA